MLRQKRAVQARPKDPFRGPTTAYVLLNINHTDGKPLRPQQPRKAAQLWPPVHALSGSLGVNTMKTFFIEPVLMLVSSLLWIVVLPIAALVCSGLAISERVETFKAASLGAKMTARPEFRAASHPSSPA